MTRAWILPALMILCSSCKMFQFDDADPAEPKKGDCGMRCNDDGSCNGPLLECLPATMTNERVPTCQPKPHAEPCVKEPEE